VLLLAGCATAPPPPPPPPTPQPLTIAVIEFAGNTEAEDGCVRAVLEASYRAVDKKLLDQVLPNDNDIDYQKLGRQLSADLIVDGGLARGAKLRYAALPRIVSAQKGDILASTRIKKRADKSYQVAHEICADLLKQLP
jgi:hypothetical protein